MKKIMIVLLLLLVVLVSCNNEKIENENEKKFHPFCSNDNEIDTKIEYVIYGEVCKPNYKEE